MDLKELVSAYHSMYEAKKAEKDYDGDGKIESGSKEHAGAVHNAIQKKKGLKPDGKDTRKEQIEAEIDGETYIIEKAKGLDGKACWKGYKLAGTKKKGGKTVDNCVKVKEHHEKDADGKVIEHEIEEGDGTPSSVEEGTSYGLYKGSGKASGAMKKYLDNAKKKQKADKKKKKTGNPAFDDPSHHSNAKNKYEGLVLQSLLDTLEEGTELDKYDAVVAYLIDEGIAEDFDDAQKVMGTLKSELVEEIYQNQLWTIFESREYSHNPEKYHDSKGYDKKLEKDKPYHKRSRAARMADPDRGINSPAFKKFMADRGM